MTDPASGMPLGMGAPKPWQRVLLSALRLDSDPDVSLGGPQHVDARLVAAARVMAARDEAVVKGRSLESLGELPRPLSRPADEANALRILSGACALALAAFLSGLDSDLGLLAGGQAAGAAKGSRAGAGTTGSGSGPAVELSEDQRLAIRFRVEKKRLVQAAMLDVGGRLKALGGGGGGDKGEAGAKKGKGGPGKAGAAKGFGSK